MAYQLASNGIKVRVLERHLDFHREFRGELLQESMIQSLKQAGIMQILIQRGLALTGVERRMFLGTRRQVRLPGPVEKGAVVSQPGMLSLLNELCAGYPTFKIDFGVTVTEPIFENGRIVAMKINKEGNDARVEGDLFIVCNGRNSSLRKACGLETEKFATTADALWLRFDFSDAPQALPKNVDVQMFGKGRVVVLQTTSGNRLHIAYSEPGNLAQPRRDLPELKKRLLSSVPVGIRNHIEKKLTEETEWQVLKIIVDRVQTWHAKGILFLGDAAHTMSPAGGQGLNLALRDTFVAANHIVDAVKSGWANAEKLRETNRLELGGRCVPRNDGGEAMDWFRSK